MKQKISNALKNEYANLGLGQKAFDGVADWLIATKTIEKEEDISTVIKGDNIKNLLKVFQGESDSLRNKLTESEKAFKEYKEKHPEQNPETKDKEDETEAEKRLRQLEEKFAAQEEALKVERKKVQDARLISELSEALKKDGCDNAFILRGVLKGVEIAEGDTVDSLKAKYKDVYNSDYKEAYGEGAQAPAGGMFENKSDDDKEVFSGVKERLKRSGFIKPSDDKK